MKEKRSREALTDKGLVLVLVRALAGAGITHIGSHAYVREKATDEPMVLPEETPI